MNMANYVTTNNPPLSEDPYFRKVEKTNGLEPPFNLPYTKLSLMKNRDRPPKLHAAVDVKQPEVQLEMAYKTPHGTTQPVMDTDTSSSNGAVVNSTAPSAPHDAQTVPNARSSVISALKKGLKKLVRSNREHVYF